MNQIINELFREPTNSKKLEQFDRQIRPLVMVYLACICRNDAALLNKVYHDAFLKFVFLLKNGPNPGIDYESYFASLAKHGLIYELKRTAKIKADVYGFGFSARELSDLKIDISDTATQIALLGAVDKLSDRCRYIIDHFYFAGNTASEIAERLKVDTDALPLHLSRCRQNLMLILSHR